MATLKAAFSFLTPEQLAVTRGLFVSLDPERDTPQQVERYAQYFHPNIDGATAKPEVLSELAKRYNVVYRKVELPNSALGYSLDHSSALYVLNKQGVLREVILHNNTPTDVATSLRRWLKD